MSSSDQRFNGTIGSNSATTALSARYSGHSANSINIASPPGSKTPPSMSSKRTMVFPDPSVRRTTNRTESEPIDPDALAMALKEYEEMDHRRDRTPGSSPCRKRQRVYGDR